ncbi:MAG: hypothetical protein ACPLRH_04340, partial [Desulfotomaculales bacterium]
LNRGLLWAAARIGGARPELVKDFVPAITSYLEDADPDLRAHSALALGAAGVKPEPQSLERLLQDSARVSVYLDGELKETTVGEIARLSFSISKKASTRVLSCPASPWP